MSNQLNVSAGTLQNFMLIYKQSARGQFFRGKKDDARYNVARMRAVPLVVSPGRGRPKKYGRPARAVTVTLPEDVLAALNDANTDLGRAIVQLVERRRKVRPRPLKAAEVTSYGSRSVIVVPEARSLRRLAGVQLVPIGNGRCLIALEPPYSIPQLELDIRDLLSQKGVLGTERRTLDAVAAILRTARVSRDVVPEERTIIVLVARRNRRSA